MYSEPQGLVTIPGADLTGTTIKVNLGCGGAWAVDGWLGIDQQSTAAIWQQAEEQRFINLDIKNGLPFPTNSVDVIFSSHTLEHFTYQEAIALLFEIYRVLKIGAPLCLVVPDMDVYISSYLARDPEFLTTPEIIGGMPRDNLADNFLMNFYSDPMFNNTCHKYAYNFENLSSVLRLTGFEQVEQVAFHEFSYWPELKKDEFRSPIPHIKRFSLSVQCRKVSFNPDFRELPAFREARKFADFCRTEQELRQQLNAVLVLKEGLYTKLSEAADRQEGLEKERTAEKGRITEELKRAQTELELESEKVLALESEILRANEEVDRLRSEKENEVDRLRCENEQDQRRLSELRMAHSETLRGFQRAMAQIASNAGINALTHYLRYGSTQGRNPSPLFDRQWYLAQYPDVAQSGLDPYVHWMRYGHAEGREPGPDASWKHVDNRRRLHDKPKDAIQPFDFTDPSQVPAANDVLRKIIALSASPAVPELNAAVTRYSPLISILLPVFNTPHRFLQEALQSVQKQTYSAWELCVVDDGSTDSDCAKMLNQAAQADPRIRVLFSATNEGIARASQQALEMATGEFIGFLDHDDMLAPNALSEAVNCLRQDPTIDFLYTDNATIDCDGTVLGAGLKPAWSPELFLSTNYIVHFKVIRRSLALEVGGFMDTLHVAQDIGLTCKLSEREVSVHHLAKVLYYWRAHNGSVSVGTSAKPTIERAALQTYNEFLARRGVNARVIWPDCFRNRCVGAYKVAFPDNLGPKVAIIVSHTQQECDLNLLRRYIQNTRYEPAPDVYFMVGNRDLVAESNNSLHIHFVETQQDIDFIIDQIDCDVLVFLSSTARIVSEDWLKELVGYLMVSPKIGLVGGKILDDRLTVRSGGLVLLNNVVPISRGEPDESDGEWLNNRIASNVDAVSSRLMATPKSVYRQVGGIPVQEYEDAAGLYYGLKIRSAGYRSVYNPWSKIVDSEPESIPTDVPARLIRAFGHTALQDRYYHPFFSRDEPYIVK